MLQAETGNNFYKEIPLSEILAVESVKTRTADTEHYFELRTANLDFFVSGDQEDDLAGWEAAIRQSLMPAEASGATGTTGASGAAGAAGATGATGGEPCSENTQALDTQVIFTPRVLSVE